MAGNELTIDDLACDNLKKFTSQNNYELVAHLGSGNFGEVFLIEDRNKPKAGRRITKSTDQVALKEIIGVRLDKNSMKEIEQEYYRMKDLHHPNIIKYYRSTLEKGADERFNLNGIPQTFQCLLLEYCDGQDLSKNIKQKQLKKKLFSVSRVVLMAKELLDGVAYLHDMRIVHRDIKPANILLHNNHIKICDFGLSKLITSFMSVSTKIAGSVCYMSPECCRGELDNLDTNRSHRLFKTDIWSIGCVLSELDNLETLFNCKSTNEVLEKVTVFDSNREVTIRDKNLEDLVRLMLTKDPDQRPSAIDLLKKFEM